MIRRIVVAIDGSEPAARAFDLAIEIGQRFEAELIVVHVVSDQPLSAAERRMAEVEFQGELGAGPAEARDDLRLLAERLTQQSTAIMRRFRSAAAERLLGDAEARARKAPGLRVRTILQAGDPATAILGVAREQDADLLALGRRGLGNLAGLLLGSVSHEVAHLAGRACLTVR